MSGVAFAAAAGLGATVATLVGPLLANRHLRDTREPTATERERLEDPQEAAGATFDRAYVIDTVGERSVDVAVRGPPGYRALFVTDYVLDELDPGVASALLAAEAARTEVYYSEVKAAAIGVVFALLVATFAVPLQPFDLVLAGMGAFALVAFAVGRRLQYAADGRAARRVGAERLADAFERVAELQGVEPESGDWRTLFEVQPPLGDRIARLRTRRRE